MCKEESGCMNGCKNCQGKKEALDDTDPSGGLPIKMFEAKEESAKEILNEIKESIVKLFKKFK